MSFSAALWIFPPSTERSSGCTSVGPTKKAKLNMNFVSFKTTSYSHLLSKVSLLLKFTTPLNMQLKRHSYSSMFFHLIARQKSSQGRKWGEVSNENRSHASYLSSGGSSLAWGSSAGGSGAGAGSSSSGLWNSSYYNFYSFYLFYGTASTACDIKASQKFLLLFLWKHKSHGEFRSVDDLLFTEHLLQSAIPSEKPRLDYTLHIQGE